MEHIEYKEYKEHIEHIKAGERYKLELLCILNVENLLVFETPTGDHIPIRACDIECISPAEPKSNQRHALRQDNFNVIDD